MDLRAAHIHASGAIIMPAVMTSGSVMSVTAPATQAPAGVADEGAGAAAMRAGRTVGAPERAAAGVAPEATGAGRAASDR